MKLLFITPTSIDFESGGAIRSSYLRSSMMAVGMVQTLLIDYGPAEINDDSGKEGGVRRLVFVNGGRLHSLLGDVYRRRRRVAAVLKDESYDITVVRYVSTALLVPLRYWRTLVIDADDFIRRIPIDESASLRRRISIGVRNAIAARIAPLAQHVWFVNPLDRDRLKTRRATYLGNVIRPPDKARPRIKAVPGRILMVGLLRYKPNSEGLLWFAREVLPALVADEPGVELHAIGRYFPELRLAIDDPRVQLRGFVEDLSTEYDQASLVVAPIHSGGGTQMKVVEALAYGRPMVASKFAHSGFSEVLNDGKELLVAADRAEWVSHCKRLLRDPHFAEAMGERGSQAVEAFGPSKMASTVKETLARIPL